MSLIKLAVITNPALTTLTSLPMLFSARAARTGNPAKYFLGKAYGPLGRRQGQRLGLAALAHMEANIRQGAVQDSTKLSGSILDGIVLGHAGRMGGLALEEIHKGKGVGNQIAKKALKYAINDNGTYNIKNIETALKAGHNAHHVIGKLQKIPMTSIGTLSGAGLGYVSGDKDHKLKSTIKGGLIGGMTGGTIKKGVNVAHQITDQLSQGHKAYFADNYWREQLEAANRPFYNKLGKHGIANPLTSLAHDRARREARSQKVQDFGDKFWKKTREIANTKVW